MPAGSVVPRRLLGASAAVGVTAVAVSVSGVAEAAVSYRPRAYPKTKIPSAAMRHALSRFTYGWTPGLQREVDAAGGFSRWFNSQLSGVKVSDSFYSSSRKWWPSLSMSVPELWSQNQARALTRWEADANYQCWVLVRRMNSKRQVAEVMTEFWEHHFHVPANGESGLFRAAYGQSLRNQALGTFESLLAIALTHPAMSVYLDNANSSKKAPNENLARELLELHSVGRGNFTESDVKNSARILTGYRVDMWRTWQDSYDPKHHWTGPVKVMGFSHPNGDADGRAVVKAYVTYLAMHPKTAQRVAHKLAVRFVSDAPSASLVKHLAAVYLKHNSAIAPVLRAIVASSEFRAATNKKLRTPDEDVVATYRALGVKVAAPKRPESGAYAVLWQAGSVGLMPFAWPRPDGRPDTAAAWSSSARWLASLEVHYAMAGGWWPKKEMTYRPAAGWLPKSSIRFDELVDHLSRVLLGRGSTSTLLKACCEATGYGASTRITTSHRLVKWDMPKLLTVFLDSPAHLSR